MMNSNWSTAWLKDAPRLASLFIFEILVLFWAIKMGYCVYGYITEGIVGVRAAVLQHMSNPYDPREWVLHKSPPHWDLVAHAIWTDRGFDDFSRTG